MGSPCGSAGKGSACNAGDLGSIPELGRSPGGGTGLPIPVFWPGEFHGLYSPWGHKELDTTEWLSLFHLRPLVGKDLIPGTKKKPKSRALSRKGWLSVLAQIYWAKQENPGVQGKSSPCLYGACHICQDNFRTTLHRFLKKIFIHTIYLPTSLVKSSRITLFEDQVSYF